MRSVTTIDDNWRVYKCACGNEAMSHIHGQRRRKVNAKR